MTFVAVATVSDIAVGEVKPFEVNGHGIIVANVDGKSFYALDDLCTHDNGPLGEGNLENGTVECPRHGARFDVVTGRVRALPAVRPLRTYPVKIDGDTISVEID